MPREQLAAPLLIAIRDLLLWFESAGVPGLLIGGVAASLLGRPRVTRDVDAVVVLAPPRWGAFLESGARFGLTPRFSDALTFAKRSRVLLLHHEPSGLDVDISLAALPFEEEAIRRARGTRVGGLNLPLPTPEDLIIFKAVAHRPRDLADVEAVLDAHPGLDLRRVRRWVREFATALEMPEIVKDLEAIIRRRRSIR